MELHIERISQHNFFQDIANEINEKFCLKSLDKMSEKLLQIVEKSNTEIFGGEEDRL